jgi:hypothetical protein
MAWTLLGISPAAAANPLKVVIIVGPTGGLTQNYRDTGNDIARAAAGAGADVVKVYSPRATWSRVRNAVAGANVVVYLGHGNGYPNPYSSGTEYTDRANGWGLNRTTDGGDSDDWSTKMVYCGEKALLGTLDKSMDGEAQWKYCGGAKGTLGIHPAANWVMIYNNACYAPGAGEGGKPKATESVAMQRVRNFSYPPLKLGAGAYFATDMYEGGEELVKLVLGHRKWTFGAIAEAANGYDAAAQRRFDHPDLSGRQVWLQRTSRGGETDYWFAYAGRPSLTPSGTEGVYTVPQPEVVGTSPADDAGDVDPAVSIKVTFDTSVTGVSKTSFLVSDAFGLTVSGRISYSSSAHRATFTPRRPLDAGLSYKATLTTDIRSNLGVRLDRYSWWFTVTGPVASSITLYPEPQPLVLEAGTNTRYLFTLGGSMRAEKTATLSADTAVSTTVRRKLANQSGTWFYVSDGTWHGYWLRESAAVHLSGEGAGAPATEPGSWPAAVRIRRGTHTGYTFSATGGMTGAKTLTVTGRDAEASELAVKANQAGTWFRMTSGDWDGFWLRASDVVYLDTSG